MPAGYNCSSAEESKGGGVVGDGGSTEGMKPFFLLSKLGHLFPALAGPFSKALPSPPPGVRCFLFQNPFQPSTAHSSPPYVPSPNGSAFFPLLIQVLLGR